MSENTIKEDTGLVLSGGGGKGAYQIGVLKALKENGYLNDVTAISGASIGAVNAMLYAMDDMDMMLQVWLDIDMSTIFDVDLENITDMQHFFSRNEMLNIMDKYIDFEKIKNSPYDIYNSICKLDEYEKKIEAEYRKLSDYDTDIIKKILLASTALPLIYESVEIDGNYYRDGGICDNEPVKPLYDAGIRNFIIIGLKHGKKFDEKKWPGATFKAIYPSYDLGDLISGTLNFSDDAVLFREKLGYKDGLRAIKTQFLKDEIYIKMENVLAKADLDEITMQLKHKKTYDTMNKKVSTHMDYFNKLSEKYDNY